MTLTAIILGLLAAAFVAMLVIVFYVICIVLAVMVGSCYAVGIVYGPVAAVGLFLAEGVAFFLIGGMLEGRRTPER